MPATSGANPAATAANTLVPQQRSPRDDLRWLISVGVLRREVDGQGLTSRFRLTPLGRQLLDDDPALLQRSIPVLERLRHSLRRHWPL